MPVPAEEHLATLQEQPGQVEIFLYVRFLENLFFHDYEESDLDDSLSEFESSFTDVDSDAEEVDR